MRIGDRLGPFEIIRPLGRSPASDVYLARDLPAGREVALKLVRRSTTESDRLAAEERGAALQRELAERAPAVAAVYDAGTLEDYFFVAMEYVEGRDLRSELAAAGGRFSEERALALSLDLLATLDTCHHFTGEILGHQVTAILHGDLKPENLRLETRDRLRILDFGASNTITATHKVARNAFGTYPYTPPEQLESGGDVDEMSDLWAVGILLYKMVAGQEPYLGSTPQQLERGLLTAAPQPLPPDCPLRLARVIEKALAFDRTLRYDSAAAFRRDLEAYATGEPLAADTLPDLGATRRTAPLADATPSGSEGGVTTSDATHRTGVPPPPPPPTQERWWSRWWRQRWRRWAAIALALSVGCQTYVAREGMQLAREARADATPDLDRLWSRHDELREYSLLGIGLSNARGELVEASMRQARAIFARYRADTPCDAQRAQRETVRAAEWRQACADVHRARLAARRHQEVRSADQYCQAQLERLAALDEKNAEARGRRLRQAVALFQEAVDEDWLRRDSFIGLMSIYAYHDPDFDRLVETLEGFAAADFDRGLRETALEADATRNEGKRLWKLVAASRKGKLSCPTKLEKHQRAHLETAQGHLERAVELYRSPRLSACSWGGDNRRLAEGLLAEVTSCLKAHTAPRSFLDWFL